MENKEWLYCEAIKPCVEQDWSHYKGWASSILWWPQQGGPNPDQPRARPSKRKSIAILSDAIDVGCGQIWQPVTEANEQHRLADELNKMVKSKSKIIKFNSHATLQTNSNSKPEEKSIDEQNWITNLACCQKQVIGLKRKEKDKCRRPFTKWYRIHEDFESIINGERYVVHL